MTRNIGTLDRIVRVIVGLGLLSLLFLLQGNARWLGLIGLVPIATAAIGYCPPYAWMGFSTCSTKETTAQQ